MTKVPNLKRYLGYNYKNIVSILLIFLQLPKSHQFKYLPNIHLNKYGENLFTDQKNNYNLNKSREANNIFNSVMKMNSKSENFIKDLNNKISISKLENNREIPISQA